MKKRLLGILALTMAAAFAFTACGASGGEAAPAEEPAAEEAAAEEEAAPAGEAKNIVYIATSFNTPFWVYCEDGIKEICEENGWNYEALDSNDDSTTQLKNAQNAISKGADAIIISPVDSVSCPAVLDEAEAAGVPVVICDIGTESGTYLSLVSTPNYDGAKEVGEYLANYCAENGIKGTIGEITIPMARINGQNRQNGFKDGIAGNPDLSMTTSLETDDFTVDEAYNQTKNIISGNPDLCAIWSHHSQATLGIVKAIDELGLTDDIIVACFDGDPEVMDYLKEGKILVCGAQQPIEMGRQAARDLVDFFAGKDVPEDTPVNTLLVTSDNFEENKEAIVANVCPVNE